jgi:hypothetical protein
MRWLPLVVLWAISVAVLATRGDKVYTIRVERADGGCVLVVTDQRTGATTREPRCGPICTGGPGWTLREVAP